MHLLGMKTRSRADTFDVEPKFVSTKLAAAILGGFLTLVILALLLLISAQPAQGQTEIVLYNFTGGADGMYPTSNLVADGSGNFYGTTVVGGSCPGWNGYGCGVVFEISPNGNGTWKETVLHTFAAPPDGANPFCAPLIFDSGGNLYGTTEFGGDYNAGSVFELSPVGESWKVSILHSFGYGGNGDHPSTGLVMDLAGNLYGTNSEYESPGSVFEVSPSNGDWTYQVLYVAATSQGVTMDAAGNLYGTTPTTVFELSRNDNGGWNATVIHTFTGAPKDGMSSYTAPVFDKAGNLYGTSSSGGAYNDGIVYKLIPITTGKKKGQWKEQVLHSFKGGHDGADPIAGVVLDASGNIYGTTGSGGKYNDGTVFELSPQAGKDWYKEKVLWAFNGTDGNYPEAGLILDNAGNLYGTASNGGTYGTGVVFEVIP
ncbi:MAG: choice-of-anchor tandem repeat GloVer-containing protein [Terriglobales bacterium]